MRRVLVLRGDARSGFERSRVAQYGRHGAASSGKSRLGAFLHGKAGMAWRGCVRHVPFRFGWAWHFKERQAWKCVVRHRRCAGRQARHGGAWNIWSRLGLAGKVRLGKLRHSLFVRVAEVIGKAGMAKPGASMNVLAWAVPALARQARFCLVWFRQVRTGKAGRSGERQAWNVWSRFGRAWSAELGEARQDRFGTEGLG